jgi:hypothetical protein
MTSPDGITWTIRTSAADNSWRDITFGNGLFVAVASSGTGNRVMTSPDGITWTSRTSAADNDWRSVTYGNGLFVAVATTGTGNRVMTSPDGITWTIRTSAADNNWWNVSYGEGLFVAYASSGTNNRVMTSPDGINWTTRTTPVENSWYAGCHGNGLFVVISYTGTGDRVMTSGKQYKRDLKHDNNYYGNLKLYGDFTNPIGYATFGDNTTTHSPGDDGDVLISGELEVDEKIYADLGMRCGNGMLLVMGATNYARIGYNISQTNDSLMIGLESNNIMLICEDADSSYDFAMATQTNPTARIHSANQSADEYLQFAHNQTDALFETGKGGVKWHSSLPITLADDASFDLPDASAGFGIFTVGGARGGADEGSGCAIIH